MALIMSNSSLVGVMFGLAAFLMFPVHDALAKWLVQDLSVWQIMFVRSTIILLLVTLINGVSPFPRAFRSPIYFGFCILVALMSGSPRPRTSS